MVQAIFILLCLTAISPKTQATLIEGTAFLNANILTADDASTFDSLEYSSTGFAWMFDRRTNVFGWVANSYLFNVSFSDGLSAIVRVNPEFGDIDTARTQASFYATAIGRLPTFLRADVETISIHRGVQAFGGGNKDILIHTGQGELYAADGFLEEIFIHEAAHTSLDHKHKNESAWLKAQQDDQGFISDYGTDNPIREDIAESILPYLAVKYRADRMSASDIEAINRIMPNRINYFDSQGFTGFPTAQVPEPATLAIFAIGLIGLSVRRKLRIG